MIILIRLFYEFFVAGLFAVGGGLATLPFLYEISEKTAWFTTQDILNLIAVSESTPGAIGCNMATYAGFITQGVIGGIIATLGLVCPSIIIITLIAKVLDKFKNSIVVQGIFKGIRPASTALIASAGLGVAKLALLNTNQIDGWENIYKIFNSKAIALAVLIYIGLKKFKKHPVVYIGISAVAGVVFNF